jgi:hypothetical protein
MAQFFKHLQAALTTYAHYLEQQAGVEWLPVGVVVKRVAYAYAGVRRFTTNQILRVKAFVSWLERCGAKKVDFN